MKALAVPTLLGLIGAAANDATGQAVPSWAAVIVALGTAFGWLRFYYLPRWERTTKERDSDKVAVDTAHEAVDFVREEYQRVTGELQVLRDDVKNERSRADDAHAQLIQTQANLAGAQASLAETLARSSTDRSTLSRQIHALEEALHVEERKRQDVCDELETVKAQLGTVERRERTRRQADPEVPPGRRDADLEPPT